MLVSDKAARSSEQPSKTCDNDSNTFIHNIALSDKLVDLVKENGEILDQMKVSVGLLASCCVNEHWMKSCHRLFYLCNRTISEDE